MNAQGLSVGGYGSEYIHTYYPLIMKNEGDRLGISVFWSRLEVYCLVFVNFSWKKVVIQNLPKELMRSPKKLYNYCDWTYASLTKKGGVIIGVELRPSMKGGMFGGEKMFPAIEGHSLGGLVPTGRIELARLRQTKEIMESFLKEAYREWQEIKCDNSNPLFKSHQKRIANIEGKLAEVIDRVGELEIEVIDSSTFEHQLPLDNSKTIIKVSKENGSPKEYYNKMVISQKDNHGAEIQIKNFLKVIFSGPYSEYVDMRLIEDLSGKVGSMLETLSEVSIVGSLIVLPRVRKIDQVNIQQGARINELRKNASEYFVFTEAILGAVFLACGQHREGAKNGEEESNMTKVFSKFSSVSIASYGVIFKFNAGAHDTDVCDAYEKWKEQVLTDEKCGYPIAYRYRDLTDVLAENQIGALEAGK